MSAGSTRLLVLGAVRIFQPAHGYLVRRELLSWGVESWAAINPGSIYNMLRTLTRDGQLAEVAGEIEEGRGPARVAYRLTPDGETAFVALLTAGLWELVPRDPHLLPAALCFLPMLTRKQVTEALEARAERLQVQIKSIESRSRMLLEQRMIPPHTAELMDYEVGLVEGELRWVRSARERVDAGHYRFADEPGADVGPVEGKWYTALEKPT